VPAWLGWRCHLLLAPSSATRPLTMGLFNRKQNTADSNDDTDPGTESKKASWRRPASESPRNMSGGGLTECRHGIQAAATQGLAAHSRSKDRSPSLLHRRPHLRAYWRHSHMGLGHGVHHSNSNTSPLTPSQVSQITIDYTDCENQPASPSIDALTFTNVKSYNYELRASDSKASFNPPQWAYFDNGTASANNASAAKACFLRFDIPHDMGPGVFLYYKLTNFYQNHRRYVKSLDTSQLSGNAVDRGKIGGSDCSPLTSIGDKVIYPCGLIANSIFNGSSPAHLPKEER
jgi:hypothetical protein